MTIKLDSLSVKKINLIDELRGRFSFTDNEKLKLPQIIVVGDQSSGKSSILEAISGIKLPRGVGTVTKCPVIIQMRQSKTEKTQIKCGTDKFQEIQNTDNEISRVQREKLKDQLTEEPITLHVQSPNVQTLTIIDLPGIVKTQTADQSGDIIEMTHNIAKMYMRQENSLIICVLPANQDINTTTTINLASECNESMSRMIGVLTKLDRINEKEASLLPDILENKKLKIPKGYYGLVVGDDFLEGDSEHRKKIELDNFRKIQISPQHRNRLGLDNFIAALVTELMALINETLPKLQLNITNLITDTKNELSQFSNYYENPDLQLSFINKISNDVVKRVENVMVKADMEIHKFGPVEKYLKDNNYLNPIGPHATFLFLWHSIFKSLYDEFHGKKKGLFDLPKAPYKELKVLDNLIKECRVENVLVFNSAKPFKIIVDKVLEKFETETLVCVEKCYKIIINLVDNVLIVDIDSHFRMIREDVKIICFNILENQKKELENALNYLFKGEHSYFTQDAMVESYLETIKSPETPTMISQPTTSQPKISNSHSVTNFATQKVVGNLSDQAFPKPGGDFKLMDMDSNKYKNASILRQCLDKYIENLILRMGDHIPNCIRLSLFVNFMEKIQLELFKTLIPQGNRDRYFGMNAAEVENCNKLKKRHQSLEESLKDLDNLRLSDESRKTPNGHC